LFFARKFDGFGGLVANYGVFGVLAWLAVAILMAWLSSTMAGVALTILFGASISAAWFGFLWIGRIVIAFFLGEVIWPVWLVAVVLSWFIAHPFFH